MVRYGAWYASLIELFLCQNARATLLEKQIWKRQTICWNLEEPSPAKQPNVDGKECLMFRVENLHYGQNNSLLPPDAACPAELHWHIVCCSIPALHSFGSPNLEQPSHLKLCRSTQASFMQGISSLLEDEHCVHFFQSRRY